MNDVVWNHGPPPRRGVHRVRSSNGRNPGYRYWNGKSWGVLCHTYAHCLQMRDSARRSPVKHEILWASRAPTSATAAPTNADLQARVAALERALRWVLDNPHAHPVNRDAVIHAALGK